MTAIDVLEQDITACGFAFRPAARMRQMLEEAGSLTDSLDAALVEDARVFHGVTPVAPLDPDAPACRDVLVVTFKKAPR